MVREQCHDIMHTCMCAICPIVEYRCAGAVYRLNYKRLWQSSSGRFHCWQIFRGFENRVFAARVSSVHVACSHLLLCEAENIQIAASAPARQISILRAGIHRAGMFPISIRAKALGACSNPNNGLVQMLYSLIVITAQPIFRARALHMSSLRMIVLQIYMTAT